MKAIVYWRFHCSGYERNDGLVWLPKDVFKEQPTNFDFCFIDDDDKYWVYHVSAMEGVKENKNGWAMLSYSDWKRTRYLSNEAFWIFCMAKAYKNGWQWNGFGNIKGIIPNFEQYKQELIGAGLVYEVQDEGKLRGALKICDSERV